MVSTRRSKRTEQQALSSEKAPSEERVATTPTPTPTKKSGAPTRSSSRRQRKKEDLKSKLTGLGLSIDIDKSPENKNKKIVFDDDLEDVETAEKETDLNEVTDEDRKVNNSAETSDSATKDDDLDDMVEEVKGSSAREEILQQLEAEEKGKIKAKAKRKRKERQKPQVEEPDEGEDFDDAFFEQLEVAKSTEREKEKLESRKEKGKHTTFVFDESDKASSKQAMQAKQVGHNIQVVVLPEQDSVDIEDAITAVPTSAWTEEALLYSRSSLTDGADRGGKKRKRNSPVLPDTSWSRSRKMNLITTPKARENRRAGRGRPAANFVTKKSKA